MCDSLEVAEASGKPRWPRAVRLTAMLLVAALAVFGLQAAGALPAEAACKGKNVRTLVQIDYSTGVTVYDVKIDSCKASQLVGKYGTVRDATGLAGALGSKWWPVGVASGVFYAWAWANQSKLKKCAKGGKGVNFREWAGIITSCSSQ